MLPSRTGRERRDGSMPAFFSRYPSHSIFFTSNAIVLAASDQSDVSPQTGDNSHIELFIVLMTVSAVGAIFLVLLGRRRRVFGK